jgi:hypothetical protein
LKRAPFLAILALSGLAAAQTDHDNVDAGRPLNFEDAEPIPYGGLAWEFGFMANLRRTRRTGFAGTVELIWGGALDTQFEIGSRAAFGNRALTLSGIDLGVLHSLRREIRSSPALAVKLEADIPTESGESAVYRLRGIASKVARQYDRLHLNVDFEFVPSAEGGERKARLGAVLGYTAPIGYSTHFDTTALAELSAHQGEAQGDPTITGLGFGVRRQVTPRSVLDLGVRTELTGRDRVPLRLIAGYSTSF